MTKQELLDLLARYDSDACSPEERMFVEAWVENRSLDSTWKWENDQAREEVRNIMHLRVQKALFPAKIKRFSYRKLVAAAALVLLGLSAALWWYQVDKRSLEEQFYVQSAVAPGSNAARLTLDDGTSIRIDEIKTGILYQIEGVSIQKLATGELKYDVDPRQYKEKGIVRNNTISIPRGGQYHLVLPDGSQVWLNSSSSLTYPLVFTGNERVVTLSGEAYFDIAKNEALPFRVHTKHTQVFVTGTKFNISSFAEDPNVLVTLASGGVEVIKDQQRVRLTPGQQAKTSSDQPNISVEEVDIDYALAWVDGNFLFEDQTIQNIMDDVARWYNVEVIYQGNLSNKRFGGTFTRNKSLDELLKHLESLSTIRFKTEERRVTVMM